MITITPNERDEDIRIRAIKNGTVIDHIEAGRALTVLNILKLDGHDGKLITVGINVDSKKLGGKKDIIKVEEVYLDNKQLNQISLISPKCTVAYIKDYEVKEKFVLNLPERFVGIFRCPNQNCISNAAREPIQPEFEVISESPVKLRCYYCDRVIEYPEIQKLIENV